MAVDHDSVSRQTCRQQGAANDLESADPVLSPARQQSRAALAPSTCHKRPGTTRSPVASDGMSANASFPEILGTAAAIVAIGGGALALCRGAMAWYRRSIGSRQILTARLNQLAAGVTTRWVEERLGPPAFVGDFQLPPQDAVRWPAGRAGAKRASCGSMTLRLSHHRPSTPRHPTRDSSGRAPRSTA